MAVGTYQGVAGLAPRPFTRALYMAEFTVKYLHTKIVVRGRTSLPEKVSVALAPE